MSRFQDKQPAAIWRRIEAKTKIEGKHKLYQGYAERSGHVKFRFGDRMIPIQRVAYHLRNPDEFPIDSPFHVLHKVDCPYKNCYSEDCLYLGDNFHNASDRSEAQTHCARGHEFTIENTRHYAGRRYCRQCHKERSQNDRDKRKRNNATHQDQQRED